MSEEEIIMNNTKLIYVVLKRLNLYYREDEFYDIGMVGLVKGVKKYDSSLGYSMSTYLYKCIYNEILMSFRRINSGREVPEKALIPLTTPVGDNLTLEDMIQDDANIEDEIIKKEEIENLHNEILKLSNREQLVINLYFGLNSCKKLKQKEIAKIIGVEQGRISKIKNTALKKLRKELIKCRK